MLCVDSPFEFIYSLNVALSREKFQWNLCEEDVLKVRLDVLLLSLCQSLVFDCYRWCFVFTAQHDPIPFFVCLLVSVCVFGFRFDFFASHLSLSFSVRDDEPPVKIVGVTARVIWRICRSNISSLPPSHSFTKYRTLRLSSGAIHFYIGNYQFDLLIWRLDIFFLSSLFVCCCDGNGVVFLFKIEIYGLLQTCKPIQTHSTFLFFFSRSFQRISIDFLVRTWHACVPFRIDKKLWTRNINEANGEIESARWIGTYSRTERNRTEKETLTVFKLINDHTESETESPLLNMSVQRFCHPIVYLQMRCLLSLCMIEFVGKENENQSVFICLLISSSNIIPDLDETCKQSKLKHTATSERGRGAFIYIHTRLNIESKCKQLTLTWPHSNHEKISQCPDRCSAMEDHEPVLCIVHRLRHQQSYE